MIAYHALHSFAEVGVRRTFEILEPCIRQAGELALAMQPLVGQRGTELDKGGDRFGTALTDTDLLIEDRLGADILRLFKDLSFHGEEHAGDRVSRYVPQDRPFILTLDPINSTATYRDGSTHFEIIMTICDRKWNMLGALAYLPASDTIFIGRNLGGGKEAYHKTKGCPGDLYIRESTAPNIVYLSAAFTDKADIVRRAGYEAVFPWRDYDGQPDWPYASCDILKKRCRGILQMDAQVIDSKAFGFIGQCANGIWEEGSFVPEKLKYSYGLSASDKRTADLLRSLL
jgi:fructose-1,6-bisphosphatase/inositol monophosphatase family enzyme